MSKTLEEWKEDIEASLEFNDAVESMLTSIKMQLNEESTLNDDEKLHLERLIETHILNERGVSQGYSEDKNKIIRLPRSYGDSARSSIERIDGVKHFNPSNLPHPIWYRDVYLKKFHPVPNPEVQHPIMTALAFLNCNAVLEDSDGEALNHLPVGYFVGVPGSGKTSFAKQISKNYPKDLRTLSLVGDTGTSIRDLLHQHFGDGDPGIFIYDNFNPSQNFKSLGRHYGLILSNIREDAKSSVSIRGKKDDDDVTPEDGVYNTYCFKIMTSIFDLEKAQEQEAREILRRLITICFVPAFPEENIKGYNWKSLEEEYVKIWSDLKSLDEGYWQHLGDLMRVPPKSIDFPDPSFWEITQVPIAVGVHLGIWDSIWEGINHFSEYFRVLNDLKKNTVKDALVVFTEQFIEKYWVNLCRENKDNIAGIEYDVDKIYIKDLLKYLNDKDIKPTVNDKRDLIPRLLSEHGYTLDSSENSVCYVRNLI